MKKNLAIAIASRLIALKNCEKNGNIEWLAKHSDALNKLEDFLPSGSGFDSGTFLDLEASTTSKLVFNTSFHHMDEYGHYAGWTEHTVTVAADFVLGFDITITGENPNGDFHDYIAEEFINTLDIEAPESEQPVEHNVGEDPECVCTTG